MKNSKSNIFKENYEKIILGVVLIALIGSLVILINKNGELESNSADFEQSLKSEQVSYPHAEVATDEFFVVAQEIVKKPVILQTGEDAPNLLVAPDRVFCAYNDCKKAIPFDEKKCPFCLQEQPDDNVVVEADSDNDGMLDSFEVKYGFNPADKNDRDFDADSDGFTNYEEFVANTDPTVPSSHPPLIDFLIVQEIKSIEFPYELKGKTVYPNDVEFHINGPNNRTHRIRKGQNLPGTNYVLTDYELIEEEYQRPGIITKSKRQVYIITLSNEHKKIQLKQYAGKVFSDREVFFTCTKDPEGKVYKAKESESFLFDNVEYLVKSVDKNGDSVVILNKSNQQPITVLKK